jgi:subtilisin family serine protease
MVVSLAPWSAAAQTRHLTVVFHSANLPSDARAIIEEAGGTVVATVPEIGVMTIDGPAALIEGLGAHPAIAAVGPEMTMMIRDGVAFNDLTTAKALSADTSTANLYSKYQWDIKQVTNNGASFGIWPGSHNTVVAIVDSGVNTHHLDLIPNFLGGRNFVPRGGYDRKNPDPLETGDPYQVEDRNGHGSHIAGTIAGNGWILGVGPHLGYRAYRVLDAGALGIDSWILSGIVAAVKDSVDVISISICGVDMMAGGFWTDPDTGVRYRFRNIPGFLAYRRAVRYAADHGVVVVAAAGNDAINIANPTELTAYLNRIHGAEGWEIIGASREVPASVPGIVTVSATSPNYSLAGYSNYGPGAIDITAPGGDYYASRRITDLCLSAYMDLGDGYDYYAWMEGTSMATPKVAAVAALIIDQAKSAGQRLTPAQVTARMQQTALDIGKKGADRYFGHGFVSAFYALLANSR